MPEKTKPIDSLLDNWADSVGTLNDGYSKMPRFGSVYDSAVFFEDRKFDSNIAVHDTLVCARRESGPERCSITVDGMMLVANTFRAGDTRANDVVVGGNTKAKSITATNTAYTEGDVEVEESIRAGNGGFISKGNVKAKIIQVEGQKTQSNTPIRAGGRELAAELSISALYGSIDAPNGHIHAPFVSATNYILADRVSARELLVGDWIFARHVIADILRIPKNGKIRVDKAELEVGEIRRV